uniref:Uncharacterized protein n=1 Tax=Caenorhabditis japonica TaxID=281687 RepID=A0A8R1DN97_CAEJA
MVFVSEFSLYLKKNYVHGTLRSGPIYPPATWGCAEITKNGIHRTTNAVEVWHRLLSPIVTSTNGLRKVVLSDIIDQIKLEEQVTCQDHDLLLINPNYQITKKRKTTNIMKDRRLLKVMANTPPPPNMPLQGIHLLRAISNALKP